MVIFDDLEAELDRLHGVLAELDRLHGVLADLDEAQWPGESGAAGWSVADVVLHLAQGEEAVLASISGAALRPAQGAGQTLDQVMDQRVQAERAAPDSVFRRWREAGQAAVPALRAADPQRALPAAA
jgi:uncharacterized protein (TIGR03083 family)